MTDTVFPSLPGLAWGTQRRPKWASRVQRATSGKRQAIGYMSYPLYEWSIQFNVLREYSSFNELQQLQGFFNTMRGRFDTFLFADPHDAIASVQQIGVGNGVQTDFQLARSYGGFAEPVVAPGIITNVRKAGVTTSYIILDNGVIRISPAPTAGQVIDWTGTFRYRCAFAQDTMDLINLDGVDIWKTNKITIESVKV
jgi:uncharacterized protein (TIGR02217 family)